MNLVPRFTFLFQFLLMPVPLVNLKRWDDWLGMFIRRRDVLEFLDKYNRNLFQKEYWVFPDNVSFVNIANYCYQPGKETSMEGLRTNYCKTLIEYCCLWQTLERSLYTWHVHVWKQLPKSLWIRLVGEWLAQISIGGREFGLGQAVVSTCGFSVWCQHQIDDLSWFSLEIFLWALWDSYLVPHMALADFHEWILNFNFHGQTPVQENLSNHLVSTIPFLSPSL